MLNKVQPFKIVLINVIVTFVETLVAVLAATDQPLSKASLVAAVGAAVSAGWNLVVKPYLKQQTDLYKKS